MRLHHILPCLLVLVLALACHKNLTPPTAPPPPPGDTTKTTPTPGTMNINLTYPAPTVNGNYELIISEPGGKLLLDTMALAQVPVKAVLKTFDTLLDVTFILDFDTIQNTTVRYSIAIFKGVTPSNWVNVTANQPGLIYPNTGAGTYAHLFCRNYPAAAITDGSAYHSFMFSNGRNNSFSSNLYDPVNNTLSLDYQRYNGAYNFLVLPHLGLYKLYVPGGNYDTLDLSHMDTALTWTFNKPSPYTILYAGSNFTGIFDTTDLSKSVSLINVFNPLAPAYGDLQYPKTPMQRYELGISAWNSFNDNVFYYGFGRTLPSTLPFPEASSFSIVSTQADNFSVTFSSPASTTACITQMTGSKAFLYIWSAPDSTTLHPETFLTNLKSKLLNGVMVTDFVPTFFTFYNVPGYSYAAYLPYVTNPALLQSQRISSYTSYTKSYYKPH